MNRLISYSNKNLIYDAHKVMDILNDMTREEAISFLVWNDSDGIYTDAACEREGVPVLTEASAKLYAFKIMWEASL